MTFNSADLQNELVRKHRSAALTVYAFLALNLVLVAIAYLAKDRIYRPGAPSTVMGLWIAVLVFGLGAFVIRRTRFAVMRLKDITALRGVSGLLKTLHGTTIQIAFLAGAISLMGFVITILKGDWTDMVRAAGVSAIVLIYCFPFRSAWQRTVQQLTPED